MRLRNKLSFLLVLALVLSQGCALVLQKGRRSDIEKIKLLENQLKELRGAKNLLEQRLAQEISDKDVSVKMSDRGLVITVLDRVLFDSGKADLKDRSYSVLSKVCDVLKTQMSNNDVGIEGHTDDQPIKYSGWKSNWELSVHRALSVLYYFEKQGVDPKRISAVGFGEYHPVAPNDNEEDRQKNRRVEIVIFPKVVKGKETVDDQFDQEEMLK